jgi:hypothetical protein
MKRSVLVSIILGAILCATSQEKPKERINVYLSGSCNDNSTGAMVESSLRESIRSSSGYALVDEQKPGNFVITLACVNAGQEGDGWTAVAYHYGLLMKATPESLGTGIWNPTLGVFTVGRAHAQSKRQELFARFDNDLHRH